MATDRTLSNSNFLEIGLYSYLSELPLGISTYILTFILIFYRTKKDDKHFKNYAAFLVKRTAKLKFITKCLILFRFLIYFTNFFLAYYFYLNSKRLFLLLTLKQFLLRLVKEFSWFF